MDEIVCQQEIAAYTERVWELIVTRAGRLSWMGIDAEHSVLALGDDFRWSVTWASDRPIVFSGTVGCWIVSCSPRTSPGRANAAKRVEVQILQSPRTPPSTQLAHTHRYPNHQTKDIDLGHPPLDDLASVACPVGVFESALV